MYEFTFETQGANSYMVYQLSDTDKIDMLILGMITNNNIKGTAPVVFNQLDEKRFLKYNISSKVSAVQIFSGVVAKERVLKVFMNIIDTLLLAEDYMLSPEDFLLDANYMFVDVSTSETLLICIPLEQKSEVIDIPVFFKNIIMDIQWESDQDSGFIVKIMNYLNSSGADSFSLSGFKELLEQRDIRAVGNAAKSVITRPVMNQQTVNARESGPVQFQQEGKNLNYINSMGQVSANRPGHIPTQTPVQNQPVPRMPARNAHPEAPQTTDTGKKKGWFSFGSKKKKEKPVKEKIDRKNKKKASKKKANKPIQNIEGIEFAIPDSPDPGRNNMAENVPNQMFAQQQPAGGDNRVQPEQIQPQPVQPLPMGQPITNSPNLGKTQAAATLNFGETTILNNQANGETTLLGVDPLGQSVKQPHLVRWKNHERIDINKPVFRIGKERSYVDYFIGDNATISRSHANIIMEDGKYYILDTNSKNHTYVDGKMIPSNNRVQIGHGSVIRFANEDYDFREL